MSNNLTVSGFWRGWHASFNKWLVRYIYVPLGGRERKALNTGAVFLFVALWHELSLSLLAWGGLNALFMAFESAAQRAIARSAYAADLQARAPFIARQLKAALGALNLWALMIANLIGYSLGVRGYAHVAWLRPTQDRGASDLAIVAYYTLVFWAGANIMVNLEERRAVERAEVAAAAALIAPATGGAPATGAPPKRCPTGATAGESPHSS